MADKIIVGISGASGIVYGIRALELLQDSNIETHLVMTKSAELTLHHELDLPTLKINELASNTHKYTKVSPAIPPMRHNKMDSNKNCSNIK